MGHYDNCRPENCSVCGQLIGYCEHTKKLAPNERQIGGTHYAGEYQHWDLVEDMGMGYLEGCATKYICRHHKKDGLKDLHKALHFIDKLIEKAENGLRRSRPARWLSDLIIKFADSCGMEIMDLEICTISELSEWETVKDLKAARVTLYKTMETNYRVGVDYDTGLIDGPN